MSDDGSVSLFFEGRLTLACIGDEPSVSLDGFDGPITHIISESESSDCANRFRFVASACRGGREWRGVCFESTWL